MTAIEKGSAMNSGSRMGLQRGFWMENLNYLDSMRGSDLDLPMEIVMMGLGWVPS